MYYFSPHTRQMQLSCKIIKKWQPPLSGLSPIFSKIFCSLPSQVAQFLEGLTPPPFNKGEGGSNYEYMPVLHCISGFEKVFM